MEGAMSKLTGHNFGCWKSGNFKARNQENGMRDVGTVQCILFLQPRCSILGHEHKLIQSTLGQICSHSIPIQSPSLMTPRNITKWREPPAQEVYNMRCWRTSRRLISASMTSTSFASQLKQRRQLLTSYAIKDSSDWNLEGWRVLLEETGELVGHVEEVLEICCTATSLHEFHMLKVADINSPGIEVLVPWVPDIVKEVDSSTKCVLIKPPDGLLELARRPEVLRKIRVALKEFGLHTEGQIKLHMPTRRQLQAAGEQKLVEMIVAAGGFLSVAQALRLSTKRRPAGFWDDLQNVDLEIEEFVRESWTEQRDSETGMVSYKNLVTCEILHEQPVSGSVMDPIPVSQDPNDSGTAVMPRMNTLREAGRFDLHQAIMGHGGYKEVAQQLGRQPVSRKPRTRKVRLAKLVDLGVKPRKARTKLASLAHMDVEPLIMEFMQAHSMSLFPKPIELQKLNRPDIVRAVRISGGVNVVARNMGLRAQRYGKGHWVNVEEAAKAMKAYMVNKLLESWPASTRSTDNSEKVWTKVLQEGSLRLPTQATILADDRKDLRYVLQKFGQEAIAAHLGIKVLTRRRPRHRHS